MIKTEKGKELLSQLKNCDFDSYQLFQDVLDKNCALDGLHAAMLTTFLYNAWATQDDKIENGTRFSAHSAGIFNVLLASGSASFQDIVAFIKKRAQLVESASHQEELFLVMTDNMTLLTQEVLSVHPDKFQLAILTDDISGVLAMKNDDSALLQNLAQQANCSLKIKQLGVKAPYHTSFLNQTQEKYGELVQALNIVQNEAYSYLFHCDDLTDEIMYQWNHCFDWNGIKEKILNQETRIIDLSPNKFISKQLMKMKKRKEKR
ncbi:CylD [Streptococcus equinus]|uniref:CylD n=1 Tax=Streptococcus equinus TaxID=1335 RepID=UPI003BF89B25